MQLLIAMIQIHALKLLFAYMSTHGDFSHWRAIIPKFPHFLFLSLSPVHPCMPTPEASYCVVILLTNKTQY